jgi:ankyrin repeat protein
MYADSSVARQPTGSSPLHPVVSSENPPTQDARRSDPGKGAHSIHSAPNLHSFNQDSNFKEDVRPELSSRPHSTIAIQDHIGRTETPSDFGKAAKPNPQTRLDAQTVSGGLYMVPIPDMPNMLPLYAHLELAARSTPPMSAPQGYWQWHPLPVSVPTIRTVHSPSKQDETSSDQSTSETQDETSSDRSTSTDKDETPVPGSGRNPGGKIAARQRAIFKRLQRNPCTLKSASVNLGGLKLDLIDPQTGETALTAIALYKKEGLAALDYLLDAGAKLDAVNRAGRTPLMCASATGNGGIVRILLQRGSKVDRHDPKGWSAIMLAAERGHYNVVEEILNSSCCQQTSWYNYDCAHGYKGDVNDCRTEDAQEFHLRGTTEKALPLVSELLGKGPAATLGKKEKKIVEALWKRANDRADAYRRTLTAQGVHMASIAVAVAAGAGKQQVIRTAMAYGAEIEGGRQDGYSAMTNAASRGHIGAMETLLDYGARINGVDNHGDTALLAALRWNNEAAAIRLLAWGADPGLVDANGQSAAALAQDGNFGDFLQSLDDVRHSKPARASRGTPAAGIAASNRKKNASKGEGERASTSSGTKDRTPREKTQGAQ